METGSIALEPVLYCNEVTRNFQLKMPGYGYQRVLRVVVRPGYRSRGPWFIRLFRVYRSLSPKKGLDCTYCCKEFPFTAVYLEADGLPTPVVTLNSSLARHFLNGRLALLAEQRQLCQGYLLGIFLSVELGIRKLLNFTASRTTPSRAVKAFEWKKS